MIGRDLMYLPTQPDIVKRILFHKHVVYSLILNLCIKLFKAIIIYLHSKNKMTLIPLNYLHLKTHIYIYIKYDYDLSLS